MRNLRMLGASLAVVAVAFLPSLALAGSAQAQSNYNGAQYQVELSLNCNNPSAPCQQIFGLGGIWGWIALMPGGVGNAQITDCGHSGPGGGGPGGAGAGHISFDPTWSTFSSPVAPSPITPTDPNGQYLNIVNTLGLPPVPATYGHYSVSFMGAKGEITIAP
jgi:hypothetical protein